MKILCLNKSWIPIRFSTKYQVIGKLYCNIISAFWINGDQWEEKNWDEWLKLSIQKNIWPENQEFIGATTQRVAIPKVVRYLNYDKIPKVSFRLSRKSIYERDNHTCYICGKEFGEGKLSIDHMIPLSRGGGNTWQNMVTCCKQCNSDKGHQLLSELKIKPKFLPQKPNLSNAAKLRSQMTYIDPSWKLFGIN